MNVQQLRLALAGLPDDAPVRLAHYPLEGKTQRVGIEIEAQLQGGTAWLWALTSDDYGDPFEQLAVPDSTTKEKS